MLDQAATRLRSRAAWIVIVALSIGVGLIAMHTGVSRPEHTHSSSAQTHIPGLIAAGGDATGALACEGCASHSSMTMVCAVLLIAVAGGVAVRLIRRLDVSARLVHVTLVGALGWSRTVLTALARPPDLHALQVMRC